MLWYDLSAVIHTSRIMADDMENEDGNDQSKVEYNSRKLVALEYPGIVENTDKMLQTLGGEEKISKDLVEGSRICLSFRPSDPFSHCCYGDMQQTSNLLLRVRRRKAKSGTGYEYKQEILGVVDKTVRFENMMDFQYLSADIHDTMERVRGYEMLKETQPIHILPPVFSRQEKPVFYSFKPNLLMAHAPEDAPEEDIKAMSRQDQVRNRSNVYAMAVAFDHDEIPTKPHEKAVLSVPPLEDGKVEEIKRLFNLRPIWSRTALAYHLKVSDGRLKQLLSIAAYYYLNGPWRSLWVKLGYNPTKDPAAKVYQVLDFRIGARKEGKNLPIPWKRTPYLSIPSNKKTSRVFKADKEVKEFTKEKPPSEVPYVFTATKLPQQKMMFYQLCDLHVSEIQSLVSANDGKETECVEKDGWCLSGTSDKIRDILVKKTIAMVKKQNDDGETSSVTQESEEQTEDIEQMSSWGEEDTGLANPWGEDTGIANPWGEDTGIANPWGEGQSYAWGNNKEVKSFFELLEGDDDVDPYEIFDDEFVDPRSEVQSNADSEIQSHGDESTIQDIS